MAPAAPEVVDTVPGTGPEADVAGPVDRSADLVRMVVGLSFAIGGTGGILLLVRRRPPLTMA